MSRALSIAAHRAFVAGQKWYRDNTLVTPEGVWLHGNQIVRRDADGQVYVTSAGWCTPLTVDRLAPFFNPLSLRRHGDYFDVSGVNGAFVWAGEWMNLSVLRAADFFSTQHAQMQPAT